MVILEGNAFLTCTLIPLGNGFDCAVAPAGATAVAAGGGVAGVVTTPTDSMILPPFGGDVPVLPLPALLGEVVATVVGVGLLLSPIGGLDIP